MERINKTLLILGNKESIEVSTRIGQKDSEEKVEVVFAIELNNDGYGGETVFMAGDEFKEFITACQDLYQNVTKGGQ